MWYMDSSTLPQCSVCSVRLSSLCQKHLTLLSCLGPEAVSWIVLESCGPEIFTKLGCSLPPWLDIEFHWCLFCLTQALRYHWVYQKLQYSVMPGSLPYCSCWCGSFPHIPCYVRMSCTKTFNWQKSWCANCWIFFSFSAGNVRWSVTVSTRNH